jgi:hypothetical protein
MTWEDVKTDDMDWGSRVYSETGRFAQVWEWQFDLPLTNGEFRILASFMLHVRNEGTRVANETIQAKANCSREAVARAVSKFRELGIVETRRRYRPDGGIAGLDYRFRSTPPVTEASQGSVIEAAHTRVTVESQLEQSKQPEQKEQKKIDDAALFEAPGAAGSAAVEKAQGRQPQAPQASTKPSEAVLAVFERLWVGYGRRGSKKTALARWASAVERVAKRDGKADAPVPPEYAAEWLLHRAKVYCQNRPDAQYRKHLERWLNDDTFWTSECEPNVMATTYTSEFDTGAEPGQMPWEGPWDEKQA